MKWIPIALVVLLQFVTDHPTKPGGIATGQVRLADGSPAAGMSVSFIPTERGYSSATHNTAVADASGQYRVDTLTPGTYYISVARTTSEFPIYYPGEPDIAAARIITAEVGKTVTADFALPKSDGIRVSGFLKGLPAASIEDEVRVLMRQDRPGGPFPQVIAGRDGKFEFLNVPPGDYLFRVYPGACGSVDMPVRVARTDIRNIEIANAPLIAGKMVVEGGKSLPTGVNGRDVFAQVWVRGNGGSCTSQAVAGNFLSSVRPDGFFVGALQVGEYRIIPHVPLGYSVKSITAGGVDLLQQPIKVSRDSSVPEIRVVLTPPDSGETLRGRLTGVPSGQTGGARGIRITDIPASGNISQSAEVPIRADGTFEFDNVPPGKYQLQALPIVMPEANPASLSGKLSITVGVEGMSGIDLPRSIFCNCFF